MSVTTRAYLSPTLVLLALDYPEDLNDRHFLGFAIKREPGFDGASSIYLPNRIGFHGANSDGSTQGSNKGRFSNSTGGMGESTVARVACPLASLTEMTFPALSYP
jgi:hypothetical protein